MCITYNSSSFTYTKGGVIPLKGGYVYDRLNVLVVIETILRTGVTLLMRET